MFSVRTAVEAVAHNKLRAGLTSLGILFGVASVIAMLAIGNGAEQEILEQMRLLGANNIVITPIVEQKEGKVDRTEDAKKQSKKFTPGLTYARRRRRSPGSIPGVGATSSGDRGQQRASRARGTTAPARSSASTRATSG